jgi:hypothetical protein
MLGTIPPFPITSSWRGAYLRKFVFMAWYLVRHNEKFTFTFTFIVILLSEVVIARSF